MREGWKVDWKPEPLRSRDGWRAFATRDWPDEPTRNPQVVEAVGDTLAEALDALPKRIADFEETECQVR